MMARLGAEERGYWQAQAMARTLGIDLTKARLRGALDAERLKNLAANCSGCAAAAACTAWIARPPDQPEAAPDFCPISDALDRLLRAML